MLIIDNATVSSLLSMAECIEAQEEAFRQIPHGGAVHRPRLDMYVPCERDDGYYRWGTMATSTASNRVPTAVWSS